MSTQVPPIPPAAADRAKRGFWPFAALLGLCYVAASAPSPLYADYALRWHFTDSTLTVVFAVYAVPLLVSLLVFGGISDEIGRKPVALTASALLAVSLVLFAAADGLAFLIAARALQGFATGLLTAVASAALLDLQPRRRPGLAALLGAGLSTGGLAAGALLSGLLVQYAWSPSRLVYLVILALLGSLAAAVAARADESVTDRVRPVLRVRVVVPAEARPAFAAAVPALLSTWALNSFYLSLGPSLARALSHTVSHLPGAISVALLTGCACLATLATKDWAAGTCVAVGCAVLAAGSGLTVVATALASVSVFYLSTVVAGAGFGLAFSGTFRGLVALARPAERGALIAATYVLGYAAFAVPAVIAGIVSTRYGLIHTALGYSAAVGGLALIALIATVSRAGRR
ncbi:MFS transporter [Actinoplanes sp. L3-i22]|uniref:MFS transporter n=1 Tax=Actinoplanes sp. L3-i22 TaxID=2836373 RepID=UPI001C78F87C|nr:MFS transporter [Actinoplanes sp. L3-i22]BCY09625.1 MFS transporter [Actinoplanes sp. L3-i22]